LISEPQNQISFNKRIKSNIVEVIIERKFLGVRILILLSCFLSFVTLLYSNMALSCQLLLVQIIVFPFITTYLILRRVELSDNLERYKAGTIISALIGAIPSTITMIITFGRIYFPGGSGNDIALFNGQISHQTIEVFLFGVISLLIMWSFQISISALIGLVAAFFVNVKKWQGH
jgi:hypothetical protein